MYSVHLDTEFQSIIDIIETKWLLQTRGGRIDPNIDSIDTNVGIGIGSILAW